MQPRFLSTPLTPAHLSDDDRREIVRVAATTLATVAVTKLVELAAEELRDFLKRRRAAKTPTPGA